ncbi:Ig-like domain-containing protein [Acidocella sp. KAb 2-4]|uniref:Ig-like domain-containing protein n=1 Tax=Acidocella sp. KAb 2-4 TaxID=2885158 RepID=UPI001D0893FB|nr:Ig-like domain-containing protein [Acidocella sp. KAb 2-4]MCB5945223.1 LysM peptidoglycan-binding domain-containing protein [Acidocella sp. KAb 2-4]
MASNEQAPKRGNKAKIIAVAVLGTLALLDVGVLLMLRHGMRTPPPPVPATAPPAAAPAAPVSTATPPEFDVVRVDTQGNAVIAGRAAPGAVVTVLDNNKTLGAATADAQGAFVLVPPAPLAPGVHDITLSEVPPGGVAVAGDQHAVVNVPGNGGQVLTVLSGPTGSTVLTGQGPQAGQLAMGAVDYDTSGHAIFSGTAPAGAMVQLSLGGAVIGQTKADAQGRWHLSAPVPAAPGMLSLSATTADGQALGPVSAPFAPETLANALADGHVVISPGDNLWLIARHVYGHGIMYTLIYSANAGQIHNPNLIFPGQNFVLPKPKS